MLFRKRYIVERIVRESVVRESVVVGKEMLGRDWKKGRDVGKSWEEMLGRVGKSCLEEM